MASTSDFDKISGAPLVLTNGDIHTLIPSDEDMPARIEVFEEQANQDWSGSGYDWAAVAPVIVAEKLPDFKEQIDFDLEAGFSRRAGCWMRSSVLAAK